MSACLLLTQSMLVEKSVKICTGRQGVEGERGEKREGGRERREGREREGMKKEDESTA